MYICVGFVELKWNETWSVGIARHKALGQADELIEAEAFACNALVDGDDGEERVPVLAQLVRAARRGTLVHQIVAEAARALHVLELEGYLGQAFAHDADELARVAHEAQIVALDLPQLIRSD